ncbi:hypothetical protein [Nocardia sp. NPDC051570]|uniref:hypothetical protein n=1 Tax=Nocardia sp. NPDC051570 TaxID=3364324 RepID=UPI003793D4BB
MSFADREPLGFDDEVLGLAMVATAVVAARASQWRTRPESRPLTVVIALFTSAFVIGHGGSHLPWLLDATKYLHMANASAVTNDLIRTAAAGYMCTLVARTWKLGDRVYDAIRGVFATVAVTMILLWQLSSDGARTVAYMGTVTDDDRYATAYGYVSDINIGLAHALVFTNVILAYSFPPPMVRVSLLATGAAALCGLTSAGLRFASVADPDTFLPVRAEWSVPILVVGIALYILAGLTGHLATARLSRSGAE